MSSNAVRAACVVSMESNIAGLAGSCLPEKSGGECRPFSSRRSRVDARSTSLQTLICSGGSVHEPGANRHASDDNRDRLTRRARRRPPATAHRLFPPRHAWSRPRRPAEFQRVSDLHVEKRQRSPRFAPDATNARRTARRSRRSTGDASSCRDRHRGEGSVDCSSASSRSSSRPDDASRRLHQTLAGRGEVDAERRRVGGIWPAAGGTALRYVERFQPRPRRRAACAGASKVRGGAEQPWCV